MASGAVSTRPPAENAPAQGRYEEFIQKRLEHTRRQVRLADVASSLMLLAIASLLFFLAVALLDHWIVNHGLNFIARLALFTLWVAGAGAFAWRCVLPPLANRINPVFAAQTIEQGRPTLKNSLINFLLLRSHPQDVAPVVYRAMEHRAAADLLKLPADHALDRGRVVHLACGLAAMVAVFALYLALSPKNPLVSAARVLWPWSSVPAPTRVHIEDVVPGDKVVFNDDREPVSAQVSGLRDGEEVALLVSTADGQVVDDRIVMTRTDDANHYRCELPEGSGGFQQDTFYRITAGDAVTQPYKLDVQTAPTIRVDRIDYHFPPYTAENDRTIKNLGDIRALEGTQVTIHAISNMDIQEARIDLNCKGLQELPMTFDGTTATGQFTLALDSGKPQYDQYQILFTDVHGNKGHNPIRYSIDVDPDLPPEVKIIEPHHKDVSMAEDGQLRIRVRASDPDFALRRVTLHAKRDAQLEHDGQAERDGPELGLPVLLDRPKPEKAWTKPFEGEYVFRPRDLNLKAGDLVHYWATADDNREPRPNQSDTAHREPRTIRIQGAGQGGQQDPQDQPPHADGRQPQNENQPQQGSGEQAGGGEKGQPGQGNGDPSGKGGSGPQQGNRTSAEKSPGKGQDSKSADSKPGDSTNQGQPDQSQSDKGGAGGNDRQGNREQGSDPNSSESGDQPRQKTATDGSQRSDVINKSLEDLQKQEQAQPNQPEPSGDNKKQDPNQQNNSQQDNNSKSSQGNKPEAAQNGGGQQGSGAQQSPSGQGNSQSSPKQGNSGGSPNGGSQPPGNQNSANQNSANHDSANHDSGSQAAGNKPTSPSNGGAGSQPKSSAGSKADQTAAGQPKSNSQKAGGEPSQQGQSAAGGAKSEQSRPGGAQAKNETAGGQPKSDSKQAGGQPGQPGQSAGGSPPNSQTKQPGGQGPGDNQVAQTGPRPEPKKAAGSGGSDSQSPPGGEKPANKPKDEGGNSQGGGQGSKPKAQEKQGGGGSSAGGGEQPKPGQGDQPSSGGSGDKPGSGKPSSSKGGAAGDEHQGQQDPGPHGEPTQQSGSGPSGAQENSTHSESTPGDANQGQSQNSDNTQPPGNSAHDPNSGGNRKGNGGAGGGQPDNKIGKGSPGTHSPANQGASASDEQGDGPTGKKAGQQVQSAHHSGSTHTEPGAGDGTQRQPADDQTATSDGSKPQTDGKQNSADSQGNSSGSQPGGQAPNSSGRQGSGLPAGGSQPGPVQPPPPSQEPQHSPDAPNLKFSSQQVDLALEHLKEQKDKPKSELLDRLGWTKEEAQKFLDSVNKLKASAQRPGSDGEAGKKAYNEFLKNLDLHPHGTQISGQARPDNLPNVRDGSQMQPPGEWADLYHAYSQSTAGQK